MSELFRAERLVDKKKQNRWDSMESHIALLVLAKAEEQKLIADVATFDAVLDTSAKKAAINATAFIVRVRALYVKDIVDAHARVVGNRLNLSNINVLVQADADYSVTEKAEFETTAVNEV